MKPKVKNILQRYSGMQLMLLAMNGNPKIIHEIDNELDRRALKELKGQEQRELAPSKVFNWTPISSFA